MRKIIAIFTLIFIFTFVTMVFADEVTDSIEKAKSLYGAGKYSEALSELNYAINLIQNKQIDQFKATFPEPLPGWDADEIQSETAGMSLLGGGISVSRTYRKNIEDDEGVYEQPSVEINMVSDSPLLSSFMMMFTNPMFLGSNKLVTVGTEKAVEVINDSGKTEELQFIVENRMMVTVKSYNENARDNIYAYAKKIDFGTLKAMLKQ